MVVGLIVQIMSLAFTAGVIQKVTPYPAPVGGVSSIEDSSNASQDSSHQAPNPEQTPIENICAQGGPGNLNPSHSPVGELIRLTASPSTSGTWPNVNFGEIGMESESLARFACFARYVVSIPGSVGMPLGVFLGSEAAPTRRLSESSYRFGQTTLGSMIYLSYESFLSICRDQIVFIPFENKTYSFVIRSPFDESRCGVHTGNSIDSTVPGQSSRNPLSHTVPLETGTPISLTNAEGSSAMASAAAGCSLHADSSRVGSVWSALIVLAFLIFGLRARSALRTE